MPFCRKEPRKQQGAKTTCAWVAALPWRGEAAAASDGKAAEAKIEHIVGWDPSLQLAWLAPTTKPEGRREPSMRPTADTTRPSDPVIACWADGYTLEVSELTSKPFAELRGGEHRARPSERQHPSQAVRHTFRVHGGRTR